MTFTKLTKHRVYNEISLYPSGIKRIIEIGMISNVRTIMERQQISIQALCDQTGLSNQTIQRARDERIKSLTLSTLERIAQALGVEVKELFDYGSEGG